MLLNKMLKCKYNMLVAFIDESIDNEHKNKVLKISY
jgi:hypothetical protein